MIIFMFCTWTKPGQLILEGRIWPLSLLRRTPELWDSFCQVLDIWGESGWDTGTAGCRAARSGWWSSRPRPCRWTLSRPTCLHQERTRELGCRTEPPPRRPSQQHHWRQLLVYRRCSPSHPDFQESPWDNETGKYKFYLQLVNTCNKCWHQRHRQHWSPLDPT